MRFPVLVAFGLMTLAPAVARAERAALYVQAPELADVGAITKVARAAIEASGWSATLPSLEPGPLGDLFTCVTSGLADDCVPGYITQADADRAVLLNVAVKGDETAADTQIVGWVYRQGGELIVSDQRYCERCSGAAVEDIARELVVALVEEARARTRSATLEVTSTPSGARVRIDGKDIGRSDLSYQVSPGRHTVVFELDGREVTREVVVGDGDVTAVEASFGDDLGGNVPSDDQGSRVVPWVITGTGIALLASGAVLIGIDQDPSPDGPYEIRNTARLGVGLAISGAVVTAIGAYLVLRHPSRGGPVAAASSDGGTVGWIWEL